MFQQVTTFAAKKSLAQRLKGGVVFEVVTLEQAVIAEDAGAAAVVVAQMPEDGTGVARMSDPEAILQVMDAVSIPAIARCRIGHFVEAQVLESIGVDFIDESEALTSADDSYFINKHDFKTPFIVAGSNLGEALTRIGEGAAMLRTRSDARSENISSTVHSTRAVFGQIRRLQSMLEEELMTYAKEIGAPFDLVKETRALGRLPVVFFAGGGVVTPADASLMMQLGVDGIFVSADVFSSGKPARRAADLVKATANFKDLYILAEVSRNLGEAGAIT